MDEPAKLMYILQKAPHGSIFPYEGLESILVAGAYDQDISVLFIDDGVFTIKKNQDTDELGIKGFARTFPALDGYDIEKLYVDEKSMNDRGLTQDDFVVDTILVDEGKIAELMDEQHALFPF